MYIKNNLIYFFYIYIMELNTLFKEYSPIKFILNDNVINKMQDSNPVMLDYDDIAYRKMRSKLSDYLNIINENSSFVYKIPDNFFKAFFISFIVLFLISKKLSILSNENQYTKEKKPKIIAISLFSILIAIVFIYFFAKNNIKKITNQMFG